MDTDAATAAYNTAKQCLDQGHVVEAVNTLTTVRLRAYTGSFSKCIDLLASIVLKDKSYLGKLINELRKIKGRLYTASEPEKGTQDIVEVLLKNVKAELESASQEYAQAVENPSQSEVDYAIITGISVDVRSRDRLFSTAVHILNRFAAEFFLNFIPTSRAMLPLFNASALQFIGLCEAFAIDTPLDHVADSISKSIHRAFLDPVPPLRNDAQSHQFNNRIHALIQNRKDFYASATAGEELIAMLSQLATTLTKRKCWKHLWTIVTCIHKINKEFDTPSIVVAAFECNAKIFWVCNRWEFHAYCLTRAAQVDPATYATRAALAALCSHDDDKQYDPFEINTGYSIHATIAAVFDDPSTDNDSLLSLLWVPRIRSHIDATVLKLVDQLRKSSTAASYQAVNQELSDWLASHPAFAPYDRLLRETVLRRQVESIARRENCVDVNQLAVNHSCAMSDRDYVEFVEPVILQDSGVPVDINAKNRTISFRNAAKKKLQDSFSQLASLVAVKPAAPTVEEKDSAGGVHVLPVKRPAISLEDLRNARARGSAFFKLQAACCDTKEKRKQQRHQQILEEHEKNKAEQIEREKQKQEQNRRVREELALAELREKARKQGLLKVIKLLRKKYPGISISEELATRKTTVFEDEMTQILAQFKRGKAESSQKETLAHNLLERALRRLDIPKRREFDEHNAELHKSERAAAKENFLAQHRKEFEKRQREREVLQTFLKDAEAFDRDVVQRSHGEKSSKRDEEQSLLEQEMRRLENQ